MEIPVVHERTVKLTDDQIKALLQLISMASFRGDTLDFIMELRNILQNAAAKQA